VKKDKVGITGEKWGISPVFKIICSYRKELGSQKEVGNEISGGKRGKKWN